MAQQLSIDKSILPLTPEVSTKNTTDFTTVLDHNTLLAPLINNNPFMDMSDQLQPLLKNQFELGQSFLTTVQQLLHDPEPLMEPTRNFYQDSCQLWNQTFSSFFEGQNPPEVIKSKASDRRFSHSSWNNEPFFNAIKQSYLLFCRLATETIANVPSPTKEAHNKNKFVCQQFLDALAPTNFAWSNPQVIEETVSSRGQNLITGMNNFLEQWQLERGLLGIKNTDLTAFELGKNIAKTPGKVVFRNELMELIQYKATTAKVFETPLLIVPAWINKFYIFDLQAHNSFIKWAVDSGHTVFVISWVNPDSRHAHKNFEDYLKEGPMAALEVIQNLTKSKQVNAIGHCLGGTLLTSLLAFLDKDAQQYFKSITLLTSIVDYSKAGDLLLFTNQNTLDELDKHLDKFGYLSGPLMQGTFNLLRSNDLIWSSFVNNYLLGKEPPAFDLLFWNSDSTHLPAAMYRFYIKNIFQKNLLATPGGLELLGKRLDVRSINTPAFVLGTLEDHIAPWHSIFPMMSLLNGPKKFVLSESGHIAGVVNPATKNKYGYWLNETHTSDPQEWLENATKHTQSWWHEWSKWVSDHGGDKIQAKDRKLQDNLEDAPGSYVKIKAN